MKEYEKEKEDIREFVELLITLSPEGKDTAKKVLVGMNLSEQSRTKQPA